MYKLTEYYLNTMLKLLIISKIVLTFQTDYDMLVMLGRLLAAPFRIGKIVV